MILCCDGKTPNFLLSTCPAQESSRQTASTADLSQRPSCVESSQLIDVNDNVRKFRCDEDSDLRFSSEHCF